MTTHALGSARRDMSVMAIIGVAHACSHFLQLAMPAVFLAIRRDWDISFTSLGMAATVFFITSGICQTLAGFAVDRFGARRMLYAGLGLFSGAVGLMAVAPNFAVLLGCMVVAGIGNSMFHPADYGILNASVTPKRLGPAFSVHGITGNIGWALAPPLMTAFSIWFGGWRGALLGAAAIGLAILALVHVRRDLFEPLPEPATPGERAAEPAAAAAVLLSLPILMCFLFFLLLAAGLIGIQTFGIPTLNQSMHLSPELAAVALTTFLVASGAGVLAGGVVAAHTSRHEHVAAAGMAAAAGTLALTTVPGLVPSGVLFCLSAAGFFSGLTNPSRDLIVRAAAPKGSTGKVYGFVYSGLDAGSACAPLLFGYLLDHGNGVGVFYGACVAWLATIGTIYLMKSSAASAGRS
jgi:FSR family fosmidomycin resistance protein-like MFS transporter